MTKALNIMKYTILSILLLVVVLPVVLYIPFVQNFVVEKTVEYLNEGESDWQYGVEKIRIGFPLELKIYGVNAVSKSTGTQLFSVGSVVTGLDAIPLFGDDFVIEDFELNQLTLGFDSLTSSLCLKGSLEKLILRDIALDLSHSRVEVGRLELNTPDVIVGIGPSLKDTLDEKSVFDWTIMVNKAFATDGSLKVDLSDKSIIEAVADTLSRRYFDYNHIRLSDLNIGINDFCYKSNLIVCDVTNVLAKDESCGLEVSGLQTKFMMQDTLIQVNGLKLDMPKSYIKGDAAFSTNIDYFQSILEGNVSTKDLVMFSDMYIPTLKNYWPEEETRFSLSAIIDDDSVNVSDLSLKIKNHVDFKIEGAGQHPFDKDKRVINATLRGDLSDADFLLSSFVAAPEQRVYMLPKDLFASIDASHRKNYTEGSFIIKNKDDIVAEGTGSFNNETLKYDLLAKTNKLNLNDFVPSSDIHGLSLQIDVDGQKFDFPGKYTQLNITAQLDSMFYNNAGNERDSLFDVNVNATLDKGQYFVQLSSGHPYFVVDTQLEGSFAKKQVSAQGYIDLQRIDLLHMPKIMSYDKGKVSLQSDIMGSYDYGDNAFADVLIHTYTYDDGTSITPFDEIDLRLDSKPGHLEATIESGDALLDVEIDKSVKDFSIVAGEIMNEVNRQMAETTLDIPSLQQKLPKLNADFAMARDNSFYHLLSVFGYRFASIDANIRNDSTLTLTANAYGFRKETTRFDTIQIRFAPHKREKDIYDYSLFATYLAPKPQNSYEVKVEGEVRKDSLMTCFHYSNGKYITIYDIDAALAFASDSLRLNFINNPTIYAQQFSVNKDNYCEVSKFKNMDSNALEIKANVLLENSAGLNVKLLTNRKDNGVGQNVRFIINNLDLNYLAKTLETGMDVGGKLNADCYLQLLPTSMQGDYTTDISSFHIGDFKADSLLFDGMMGYEGKQLDTHGKLTIDRLVKLNYLANVADSVDVNVGVHHFPLPLVNAFLPTNMQFSGETTGNIRILGKDFEHSNIEGYVKMHKANLNYADLDANILFPEDSVTLRRNRIRFRDYKLLAANQHPLHLDGTINFRDELSNPELNLTMKATQMHLINNTKRKNKSQFVYGKIPVNLDMNIKGKVSDLVVNGTLSALEGTNIEFYLEEDPLNVASKVDELVEFVSFRQIDRMLPDDFDRQYRQSGKNEGLKLDMKLNIASNAKVNVHLPTNKNDYVNLIGGGQLNLATTSNGELEMSGLYDINGGEVNYKLPVLPMTKKFELSSQSWLSWNGAIASPAINLIAIEKVKTNVNDNSGARIVQFDVAANISGSLKALDVTFDCTAPEDGAISSEMSAWTAEDRSKQAILLLIAQTYMGPGSTNSMGLSSANAALNSVLNKQIGKLLTNKMKNTDINFDINSYDADGTMRTDYSMKVSQRLFNDRIRVTVGGKLTADGNDFGGKSEARINDLSLEYLTKEDGSSYARLFRKTNFQNILEGEIVETGIGYVQQRSAFKFWNLFLTNKKRQREMEMQIEKMKEDEKQAEREQRRNRNRRRNDTTQQTDSLSVGVFANDSIVVDSVQHNK